MKLASFLVGLMIWAGVGALAIGMAAWDRPVLGFFPIAVAVVLAWMIGEYITDVWWREKTDAR